MCGCCRESCRKTSSPMGACGVGDLLGRSVVSHSRYVCPLVFGSRYGFSGQSLMGASVPNRARSALMELCLGGEKRKTPLLRCFSEGCVLQRCTCGYLCSPLSARSCPDAG